MPRPLAPTEARLVADLSPGRRLGYCVGQAVDTGELWTLRTPAGWVVVDTAYGPVLPLWPHPDFAACCAVGDWDEAEPACVPVADFLAAWPIGAKGDGRAVIVFPVPGFSGPEGAILPSERFAELLREELG